MALLNVFSYVALEIAKFILTFTKGVDVEEISSVSLTSGTGSLASPNGLLSAALATTSSSSALKMGMGVVVASSSPEIPLKARRVSTTVEWRGRWRNEKRRRRMGRGMGRMLSL